MPKTWLLASLLALPGLLCAQGAKLPAAPLQAGEGLALATEDGAAHLFGDCQRESPMGDLAQLVWLRLEGINWNAQMLTFKCTGSWDGLNCTAPKGHGRVDVSRALAENCRPAFLAWTRYSAQEWRQELGDGVARLKLEEGFGPFLGKRLPVGNALPPIGPAWIGEGDLLRTSPEALLAWFEDPTQAEVLSLCRRLLLSAMQQDFKKDFWWFKTGSASGETTATGWVVASNGRTIAVLRLPKDLGQNASIARLRALLGLPATKK